MEIEIPPGAYELVDMKKAIQQEYSDCSDIAHEFEFNIEADTISMKLVLTTSFHIYFNSELNNLLGFTKEHDAKGTHIGEKPVMIT